MEGRGFFAIKQKMETFFDKKNGIAVAATSFLLVKNTVCQVKHEEKDGYNAYQVVFPAPNVRKKKNAC
jgi:ribosomal protein L3